MSKLYTLVLLIIFASFVNAQAPYIDVCSNCDSISLDLDCSNIFYNGNDAYFVFDTTQSNNLWQFGNSTKPNLNSGLFGTASLITDTMNTYATNNTSSFELW